MATLEKSITINAPAKKVFTFLSKPENWKEIYPKITEIRDVNQLLSGGYRYSWRFKMVAGIPCEVRSENTELVANRSIGLKNTCSIGGVRYAELDETLYLNPEDGKTKLTDSYIVYRGSLYLSRRIDKTRQQDVHYNVRAPEVRV
jgi:ligand-binding SRPBCC domain-containing protein